MPQRIHECHGAEDELIRSKVLCEVPLDPLFFSQQCLWNSLNRSLMLVIHRVPVPRATRNDHTRRHHTLGGTAMVGARCATGRTRALGIGRR